MSKVIIVTGASRGIGFETAQQLADRGHRVFAVARSAGPLGKLQGLFPEQINAVPADLTDEHSVGRLVEAISSEVDGVNILINNAGVLINKPFEELSLDEWRAQLDSNLISAVNITKQLLPHFNTKGHILNISSMGGFQGSTKFPGLSAYSVSKGALSILTESLAAEFKDRQLAVNALCLGAVHTEMFEAAFPGFEAPVSPEEMGSYIADFSLSGSTFYNGKILPVALEDPE
ncbi:SDR family NAD(P)-dependent oxidoreductase [Fodinibius sediminis]|nr:SDR family oxidoreductase [Fodinibius sediminis]